jgi:hypothetical protein
VLVASAAFPLAVSPSPVLFCASAKDPEAVLDTPASLNGLGVTEDKAPVPIAVFHSVSLTEGAAVHQEQASRYK